MILDLSQARPRARTWQWALVAFAGLSLLLSVAGVMLKSRIVTELPASVEQTAEPPVGIFRFLDGAIDSWKPMMLALTILHSPAEDRLFETLAEFQETGKAEGVGDLSYFSDSTKFQYPLSSLLPIEVLDATGMGSIRGLNIVNALMFIASLAAIGWLAVEAVRRSDARYNGGGGRRWDTKLDGGVFALAVAVGFTFHPSFMALVKGNIQVWINCLFAFACLAWVVERRVLAGVLIALCAAIKPQFAALLVWALLWKEWSFSKGFLYAAIPIGLLSVYAFGLHNNLAYLDVLARISSRGEDFVLNESVNGIVHRLVETDVTRFLLWNNDYAPYRPVVHALTVVSTLVFAAIAFVPALLRRGTGPTVFDFATAAICFTIGSPIVWPFHYGVLLPIFVIALVAAARAQEADRNTLLLMIGAAWLLVASYLPFTRLVYEAPWNILANPHFFGGLLLLLVLYRLGRGQELGAALGTSRSATP
ncbi:glycosyltransferase family 87 protein [Hyphomicrobium sp.]|uniref:glycosyltransferase family 87 protein n=1 Tax=Hyphomicrobium sp. TaxID=82 RepID=UPI0025BC689A|nr:glycosyltransferase family 87 protein [Hyphomicrobium sp.]MCC7250787.1 DUF2029 domain-containing protein [Hyphomicrobium sp.]